MMNKRWAAETDPLPTAFYSTPSASFVDRPFADNRQA
jgi:hypothetical protein